MRRPRVLFAGASGYGNIGDDAYRIVFSSLNDIADLRFHSPYPDLKAVDWCDYLVIGGGGLIYCNETAHFDYMKLYMDRAIHRGTPIMFSSVGVQLRRPFGETEPEAIGQAGQIAPWSPYLKKAKFITVRSPTDKKILWKFAADPLVFPDACYSFPRKPSHRLVEDGAWVAIPMGTKLSPQIIEFAQEAKKRSKPFYLVGFSPMDPINAMAASLGMRSGERTLAFLTPDEVVNSVFAYSDEVMTTRYHGRVLARAAGIDSENIRVIGSQYKNVFEPKWLIKANGERHVDAVRNEIG